ncbi:hypothetical protein BC827DRAFT_1156066 [Russula dissimulans]|nr:hypothetical protein BC827DRAFT_1156066 [Russula dissimulans]
MRVGGWLFAVAAAALRCPHPHPFAISLRIRKAAEDKAMPTFSPPRWLAGGTSTPLNHKGLQCPGLGVRETIALFKGISMSRCAGSTRTVAGQRLCADSCASCTGTGTIDLKGFLHGQQYEQMMGVLVQWKWPLQIWSSQLTARGKALAGLLQESYLHRVGIVLSPGHRAHSVQSVLLSYQRRSALYPRMAMRQESANQGGMHSSPDGCHLMLQSGQGAFNFQFCENANPAVDPARLKYDM